MSGLVLLQRHAMQWSRRGQKRATWRQCAVATLAQSFAAENLASGHCITELHR